MTHERADRQLVAANLSRAVDGVDGRVDLREAMSALPEPISFMLSTEPPVTSRRRRHARHFLGDDAAEAAGQRIVDAAGAAGCDR